MLPTGSAAGRDGSVGIATLYGLGGPRIETLWGEDFPHPSRPALESTQPPTQWVPGISRVVNRLEHGADHPRPSSVEVKDRVQLYLYSPFWPSWSVLG